MPTEIAAKKLFTHEEAAKWEKILNDTYGITYEIVIRQNPPSL